MRYGSLYFGKDGFLYKKAGGAGGRKNPPLGLLNCGSTTFYNKYVPGSGVGGTSIAVRRSKLRIATSCKNTNQICGTFYPKIGIDWNVVSSYTRNGSGVYLQRSPIPPPQINPCPLLPSITPYQVCSPWPHSRGIYNTNNGLSPFLGNQIGALKWKNNLMGVSGSIILSSPAIAKDGTIYIGSFDSNLSGNLYAIDSNGNQKWSYKIGSQNLYASPAIGPDGTIYISGGSENTSLLYAIKPDGTLKWSFENGQYSNSSPVIGTDGTIYICGTSYNYVFAINAIGTLKWINNMSAGNSYGVVTPVIGSDGTIYVGSIDATLYAINPLNGITTSYFETEASIYSSPAIGPDGTIYISSSDNFLYAIQPTKPTGTLIWKIGIPSYSFVNIITSSPAIGSDGTIYIGSIDNKLYAIYPADGSIKWTFSTGYEIKTSPVIGSDGTIYVGSKDNKFYAINPDGSLKWFYTTGNSIESSAAIGSDGTIYFGSDDFYLYAIGG